VKLKK